MLLSVLHFVWNKHLQILKLLRQTVKEEIHLQENALFDLSDDKQADIIDAFNTTSRYFDHILNINNVYFDNMVSLIYPSELQLNKANTADTEAEF